jgi:hypothetical protein
MQISKYFFSLLVILVGFGAVAQKTSDSLRRPPKEPIDWKPSMFRAGLDIGGMGMTLVTEHRTRYEGMLEMDLGKWFLVGEMGSQSIERGEDYHYRSSGNYWRIGVDKNLTTKLTEGHAVSFGLRYARSQFEEQYEDSGLSAQNLGMSAGWVEITTGIRMRIWNQLFMGYQLRLKGMKRLSNENTSLQTYDIPGFGRNKKSGQTVRTGGVGFNYYIYWTIPFREKKVLSDK